MLALNAGSEMLLDAILLAINNLSSSMTDVSNYVWKPGIGSDPVLLDFNLSWRQDAEKLIIIFSDEEPQSFLDPSVNTGLLAAVLGFTPELKSYVFSQDPIGWNNISNVNGGGWYLLESDTGAMLSNLLEILDENVCQ